jgi:hypothetical protein
MSTAITAALVGFFLQYASAFRGEVAGIGVSVAGHAGRGEATAILGVASVLITNAVLLGTAAVLLRAWNTPFGSLTFVFGTVALLLSALDSFERGAIVLSAVAAGAVADLLVARGRAQWALPVAPLVMWPAWFGLLRLTGPMLWSTNFWCGTTYLAVLTGVGLNLVSGVPALTRERSAT